MWANFLKWYVTSLMLYHIFTVFIFNTCWFSNGHYINLIGFTVCRHGSCKIAWHQMAEKSSEASAVTQVLLVWMVPFTNKIMKTFLLCLSWVKRRKNGISRDGHDVCGPPCWNQLSLPGSKCGQIRRLLNKGSRKTCIFRFPFLETRRTSKTRSMALIRPKNESTLSGKLKRRVRLGV